MRQQKCKTVEDRGRDWQEMRLLHKDSSLKRQVLYGLLVAIDFKQVQVSFPRDMFQSLFLTCHLVSGTGKWLKIARLLTTVSQGPGRGTYAVEVKEFTKVRYTVTGSEVCSQQGTPIPDSISRRQFVAKGGDSKVKEEMAQVPKEGQKHLVPREFSATLRQANKR